MELRWLTSFVAVAEDLHFGHAADRLYLAPSALSAQIKALETELGVRLVDRGRRSRIRLTGAGELFLAEARLTLAQVAKAEAVGRRASWARPRSRMSPPRPSPAYSPGCSPSVDGMSGT